MQCMNYELQYFVLHLFRLQGRFHSGRTLAVRYGCHGASAHWSPRKQPRGLGFWTHGYSCKHRVFHKNHEIFHVFRMDPGICRSRSAPFQESKCRQMFIWQKQPWLNLPHIIIPHTHNMIYHIKSCIYTSVTVNIHTHQLPCHFMLDLLVVDQICRHDEAQCRPAWNQHWHHSALPGKQPVLGGRSVFVRPISQSSWLKRRVQACSQVQSLVISIDH